MARGGLTAPNLHTMMAKYKRILDKQIDKVEADPDPDPEKLKIIDRMMRTVQDYDRAQERKEERKEALELKKAGHELNVKKAAATAERQAQAESGAPKAKDFDNTQLIKEMRHEMFKDVFTPEGMAECDRLILEADKKALAEGIKFVPYVPPAPSPNDPWHPTNPS
jgi:hypothetical protein